MSVAVIVVIIICSSALGGGDRRDRLSAAVPGEPGRQGDGGRAAQAAGAGVRRWSGTLISEAGRARVRYSCLPVGLGVRVMVRCGIGAILFRIGCYCGSG